MSENTFVPTTYLSFDGKDDYVALPAMNIDWSKGLTIEAWVRCEKFNHYARIVDFFNPGGANSLHFFQGASDSSMYMSVFSRRGGRQLAAAGMMETGVWIHVAVTTDTADVGKIYKNGKLVATGPLFLPDSLERVHNWIGRSQLASDGYFQGQMAELRVWNVARSEQELQRDMSRRLSGSESGLVAYLPMDEGFGDTAHDLSPSGFHATRQGASWMPLAKPASRADIEGLERRVAGLEARLAQCSGCADKLAALESKLAALEGKLAALAEKAARCGTCEERIAAEERTRAELSARVDEVARKCAEKHFTPEPVATDNLESIEGIGPKIAEVLQAAGIRTLKQLAATDVAELQKILKAAGGTKFARNDPSTWPKQARLMVEGKKAELQALQDTLRAGRPTV